MRHKNDKNCFYFVLKALFVLEIFKFLSWLCGYVEKHFDNFKFMTSEAGQQISTIHILPNISRSKGNKTMNFFQLIEYNMINTFIEKLYLKCGGKASPRPFIKTQNWAYLWINRLKGFPSRCLPKYIKTKVLTTFFYFI